MLLPLRKKLKKKEIDKERKISKARNIIFLKLMATSKEKQYHVVLAKNGLTRSTFDRENEHPKIIH